LTGNGYRPVKAQRGWLRSAVFGMEFRLGTADDPAGYPEFTLQLRR
jgi:hypothetical protein